MAISGDRRTGSETTVVVAVAVQAAVAEQDVGAVGPLCRA